MYSVFQNGFPESGSWRTNRPTSRMPSAGRADCPQSAAVEAHNLRARNNLLTGNEFCESLLNEPFHFFAGLVLPFATQLPPNTSPERAVDSAQGLPSLSEATLGLPAANREANRALRHTPRSPAASATSSAAHGLRSQTAPQHDSAIPIAEKRTCFQHVIAITRSFSTACSSASSQT